MSGELNINIPFTSIVYDRDTSDGSRKVFELQSGYYFMLETGKFANGDQEITIQKSNPECLE